MFRFHDPGRLVDGDLELVLTAQLQGDPEKDWVPSYEFDMRHVDTGAKMGGIALRCGNVPNIVLYAGHIGYGVDAPYRGHHYAARACKLLLPLARLHGLNPLWITCNPDNYASRRTCELAGAQLAEIVDLPVDNEMYLEGERQKCRYRIDL
jgi:tagatose 1,6-diphosphate aldolase